MDFIDRNWVLFEANEISSIMYNKMHENSADDLIYNADRSKAFGSFSTCSGCKTPTFLSGKTIYSFEEFANTLNTSW